MILNLSDAVAEYIGSKKREYKPRTPGEYWATEPPKCLRQWYLDFTTPPVHDPERQGVFETGAYVEEFIGEVIKFSLRDTPIDISIPQRSITLVVDAEDDVQINGKADFLVLLKSRTHVESQLIEVKSANGIHHIQAAKFDHIVQLMPYIKVLKPDHATIVYVNRMNVSQVKQFDVEYDPAIMAWIIERTKKFDRHIKTATLPMAEARYCRKCWKAKLEIPTKERLKELGITTRSKMVECPACHWVGKMDETELWRCSYCPFKKQCFDIENERDKQALLAPEPDEDENKPSE